MQYCIKNTLSKLTTTLLFKDFFDLACVLRKYISVITLKIQDQLNGEIMSNQDLQKIRSKVVASGYASATNCYIETASGAIVWDADQTVKSISIFQVASL